MSRSKRHHYSYFKLGGIIVTIHHSIWVLIAVVVGGLGVWFNYKSPSMFIHIIIGVLVVIGILLAVALYVLYRLFRAGKLNPSVVFRGEWDYEEELEPEPEDELPPVGRHRRT